MSDERPLLPHEIDQIEMDMRQERKGVPGFRGWMQRRMDAALIARLRKGESFEEAELSIVINSAFLAGVSAGVIVMLGLTLIAAWLVSLHDWLGWAGAWLGVFFIGFVIGREIYHHWRRGRCTTS